MIPQIPLQTEWGYIHVGKVMAPTSSNWRIQGHVKTSKLCYIWKHPITLSLKWISTNFPNLLLLLFLIVLALPNDSRRGLAEITTQLFMITDRGAGRYLLIQFSFFCYLRQFSAQWDQLLLRTTRLGTCDHTQQKYSELQYHKYPIKLWARETAHVRMYIIIYVRPRVLVVH